MTGILSSSDARTSWVATSGFHASPEQCIYKQTDRKAKQDENGHLAYEGFLQKQYKVVHEKKKKITYSVAMVADFDDEVVLAKVPY